VAAKIDQCNHQRVFVDDHVTCYMGANDFAGGAGKT